MRRSVEDKLTVDKITYIRQTVTSAAEHREQLLSVFIMSLEGLHWMKERRKASDDDVRR